MKLPVKIKQFEELANNKEAELDSYKEAYGEFILESNKWYKKLDRMLQDIIEDPQPRTDEHRRIMDRLRNHLEKLKMDFTGSGSSIDAQIDVIRNLAKRFGVENE